MTTDVAARMEQVLGSPPRIEPLDESDMDPRAWELIGRLRAITDFPRDAPAHPFFATLSRLPAFFEAYMGMGITAMGSAKLGRRERELVILRTGWLCGAPYAFGEHVLLGKQIGITSEEIEWIKQGSAAPGWSDDERALIAAAEEIHHDRMISDATWAALAARLGPDELIELTMIVGHYQSTAMMQNTLRFRLNPECQGLEAC